MRENGEIGEDGRVMIGVGSDHGGFQLKEAVREHLEAQGIEVKDYGVYEEKAVDYPDIAAAAAKGVTSGEVERALLFCGTGIGICMAANKVKGIRAAVCSDCFSAKLTREHNDANILCMGGRVVGAGLACMITDAYLNAEFQGGRHAQRVAKVMALEER